MSSFSLTLVMSSLLVLLLGALGLLLSRGPDEPASRGHELVGRPRIGEILWTLSFAVGLVAVLVAHVGN